MKPFVSVIIVNYNGLEWLKESLSCLQNQTYESYELILVDNASSDESLDFVKKNFPHIKLVKLQENVGFAQGNNEGLKHAKGELIILLNNDTSTKPDYIDKFVKVFKQNPKVSIAQSKIVLMNEKTKTDSCGSFWTHTSFLAHFGFCKNQDLPVYNQSRPIFAAMGASMIIKREVIEKIGLFDPTFWSYYEETDFCHRAWMSGFEVWYWPEAVICHAKGGTSTKFNNDLIQFHNFKNKLRSYLKNFSLPYLIFIIPTNLFLSFGLSLFHLFKGRTGVLSSFMKAVRWNLRNFSDTMHQRARIQKNRMVKDDKIFKKVSQAPSLKYYYYLLKGLKNYSEDVI